MYNTYACRVTDAVRLAAPEGGTAQVWWARRQDASAHLLPLLDQAEHRRWTAYRREQDRERFLVGCALAKAVIAGYDGLHPAEVSFDRTCRQCGQPHGKPVIRGRGGLGHSVAHSGDLVVLAVARDPVGVDVEQLDGRARGPGGDPEALAAMVLSAGEREALAAVPAAGRARAFLVAWTRKEAVTKATGDGLRVPFSGVVVAADGGTPRLAAWPYPQAPDGVSLLDLEAPANYVAALAVVGRCDAVQASQGSALLARLAPARRS
jgi:4'-phosphopantetheinyl transferase